MERRRLIVIIIILSLLVLPSCKNKHSGHDPKIARLYTCSMHPQIIRTEPGNCPICGMALVEKVDDMAGDTVSGLERVISPVYQKFLFSQKTIKTIEKNVSVEINADGIITYDTRYVNNISARVSGRIDRSFIKYSFQQITKGQKIFEIYSPDLLTAQQNMLFLIKNDSNESALIEASKEKLRLLGLTEAEITEVIKSGKAKYLISVYSDYSGYVVNNDYNNDLDDQGNTTSGMSAVPVDNASGNSMNIREGAYVSQGETMFKIINNSSVWAMLKIVLNDYPFVKTNQNVEIFSGGKTEPAFTGIVNYIETSNPDNLKTINVRVFINNADKKFKIGQVVSAKIYSGNHLGRWLPSKSILDLGKRKIVFVKKKNFFVAKIVTTGITYRSWTEIVSGIDMSDEVASNAQFFFDSESFIKTQDDEK